MEAVNVDVVLLTWNDSEVAHRAVTSVVASRGLEIAVWVVDNGSVPEFAPPRSVSGVLRHPENQGVARGRNSGATLGKAPLVCFLDSDATVDPDALRLLAGALEDPRVAMAVPVFADQPPEASAGMRPSIRRKLMRAAGLSARYGSSGPGPVREVDFAIGACQVIRRSVFDQLGGFDARIFYGPEDIEFCDRVRAAGWRILQIEDAVVRHEPRRRNRSLLTRRGRRHALSLIRFYMSRSRP